MAEGWWLSHHDSPWWLGWGFGEVCELAAWSTGSGVLSVEKNWRMEWLYGMMK